MTHPPRHRAVRALCLLLALTVGAAPALQAQVRLPALGESASDEFNLSVEKRLGEQIMRDIRRDPDYVEDPVALDYLQSIWQPLVAAARQRGDIGSDVAAIFPFEIFLVRDRSVNAFALPGGYVGTHLGLIAMTATRDELASVLAHELSHLTRRHIARSVDASSRSSMLGLAAMILGVLAASRSANADVAQAAIATGQAAAAQLQLNFSRDMEREADRTGQALMAEAGFAPSGMAAMFNKLDAGIRLNDNGLFPYLRSHPLTIDRIGEAQQRATQMQAGAATNATAASAASPSTAATGAAATMATTPVNSPEALQQWHALMQSRAKVLMDPAVDSLRRWQELDARQGSPEERQAGLYAGALASMQLRDFGRAQRALAAALVLPGVAEPGLVRRAWLQLATQLALARGDLTAAAHALRSMNDEASRPALLLRAQVALASGDGAAQRSSVEALQTWVSEHRNDAQAWQQLALGAEAQGQALRAVRAAAEAQAAIGNLPGAIDRLRAGQQLARRMSTVSGSGSSASSTVNGADFIDASVIDARLRDLQSQRRELLAEQRGNRRGSGRPEGSGGPDNPE